MFSSWSNASSGAMASLYQKRNMTPWNTCYLQVSLYLRITWVGVHWYGWWFVHMLRNHNILSSNPAGDLVACHAPSLSPHVSCLTLYWQKQAIMPKKELPYWRVCEDRLLWRAAVWLMVSTFKMYVGCLLNLFSVTCDMLVLMWCMWSLISVKVMCFFSCLDHCQ